MAADCAPDIEPKMSLEGYRMVLDQARFHAQDDGHRDLRCFDRDTGEEVKLTWEINTDSGYVVTYAPPDPATPFQRTLLKRHGRFAVYEGIGGPGPTPKERAEDRLQVAQEEYRAAIEAQARLHGLPADQRLEMTITVADAEEFRKSGCRPKFVKSELRDDVERVKTFFDARVKGAGKYRLKDSSDNRQPDAADSSDRFSAATRALSKG